jgi:hypothetical protein
MRVAVIDFETFSHADINKSGVHRYATHPTTEVLMLAWVVDPSPDITEADVSQWVPAEGQPMPQELAELLDDPTVILEAHNAPFERLIFKHVMGRDIETRRWRDTMVRALYAGLTGALDKAGAIVGLSEEKAKLRRGKALLKKFCTPAGAPKKGRAEVEQARLFEDTLDPERVYPGAAPQDWEEFKLYNRQDVVATVHLAYALRAVKVPDHLWEQWFVDQAINDRGVPTNRRMVCNAIRLYEEEKTRLMGELRKLTGLDNPNSGKQMLPWLRQRGYVFDNLRKESVTAMLARDGVSPELRQVLEIWQRAALRAATKYSAILAGLSDDDHQRHVLQFWGASRTGRWAGRRFQPQNLPRPPGYYNPPPMDKARRTYEGYVKVVEVSSAQGAALVDDVPTLLKSCLRGVAQAPEGHVFIDADLSAIENIVLGWSAGEEKILRVFREGRDPYVDFATYMFGQSYDEIAEEVFVRKNKKKRTIAKPGVLGCFGPDTEVLTANGWQRITEITPETILFDGVGYYTSDGCYDMGVKEVVDLSGVWATPDHRVLGERGWITVETLKSDPENYNSARRMAETLLSNIWGCSPVQGSGIVSGATKGMNLSGDGVAPLIRARRAWGGVHMGIKTCRGGWSRFWRIVSTPLKRGAINPMRKNIPITVDGGYAVNLRAPKSLLRTYARCPISTSAWSGRSTESTTTGIMSRAISGWQHEPSRHVTIGRPFMWIGRARECARQFLPDGFVQNIRILGRFCGSYARGCLPLRSSRSMRVFDLVNAGPRNRYIIRTNDGPLVVHNCGYMLGAGTVKRDPETGVETATGLIGYARDMGIDMTPEQAEHAVNTFRSQYLEVKRLWYRLYDAVCATARDGEPRSYRAFRTDMAWPWLRLWLPSGRSINYYKPKADWKMTPWGEDKLHFSYEGRRPNGSWGQVHSHPGKIVENVVQALARDILAVGVLRAEAAGLDVRLHVHDQIVAVTRDEEKDEKLALLVKCLTDPISWVPDIPLKAGGFWSRVFMKEP